MDWWQAAGVTGTFVATGVGVVALVWRMLRDLRREFRRDVKGVRQDVKEVRHESREAHAKIGERITQVHKDLSGEIAELRQGQTGLLKELGEIRGELGEIRGELKGVTRSVDTLRQDFRAHVLGSAGAGS